MLDTEALVYKYMASICSQKMSNDVVIIIPRNWATSSKIPTEYTFKTFNYRFSKFCYDVNKY